MGLSLTITRWFFSFFFSKISTWIQRIFFGNFLYIFRKGTEIRFCITGIICSYVQSALSTTH